MARRLRSALDPGDRCAVLARNGVEYLILSAAASRAGVVLVPLNPRGTPAEWDHVVADAGAMLLACGPGSDGVRLPAMPVVGLDELFPGGATGPPGPRAAPDAELLRGVDEPVARYAALSPAAVAAIKHLTGRAFDAPRDVVPAEALPLLDRCLAAPQVADASAAWRARRGLPEAVETEP